MLEMHSNPFLCAIEVHIEAVLSSQMYNIPGVGFERIVSDWVFYNW